MAREMDFVENDWSAALWAFGSIAALFKCGFAERLERILHPILGVCSPKGMVNKIPAMLSGMIAAGAVLAMCLLLLSSLLRAPWLNPELRKVIDRLLFVVVPEGLYLAGAVALWRQRKAMAVGIMAAGVILMAHAVVHFVTHWVKS